MRSYAISVRGGVFAYSFSAVNDDNVTIYYNYINNNTEAEVTYQTNSNTASYTGIVNIPKTVNNGTTTLPVTSIGQYAFYSCKDLTSVTIPNSVTTIGTNAFEFCSSIKSVTIPNSVTTIGNHAFDYCTSIASVTIGKSVTDIGAYAFNNCDDLASIVIPNSVKSIGVYAFFNCDNLASVTIGKSTTSIGEKAFGSCPNLKELTLRCNTLPKCDDTFSYGSTTSTNIILYCKAALLNACNASEPWKNFKERKVKPFSITISDAGMATGCFDDDLDFSNVNAVKAYIVSAFSSSESKVLMSSATKIPEGIGFVVKGTVGTYEIPAATTDYKYANMLVGVLEETTVSATDDDYTNYILSTNSKGTVGFYKPNNTQTLSAYKAYLRIPTTNPSEAKSVIGLSFDDEDDTTGISAIKDVNDGATGNTTIYNLNGQRKQSLTKGLNIVNGKKIFIK